MDVSLPAQWLADGHLPKICARHGGPATRLVKRAMHTRTPFWVIVIAPFSLLIAAIIASAIRKTVKGQLSGCRRCTADRWRFRAVAWAGWLLSFVVLGVAGSSSSGVWVLLWLVATLGALVLSFSGDRFRVRGHLSTDLVWVNLKGVHEAFATPVLEALRPPATTGGQGVPAAGTASVTVLPGG